MKTVTVATKLTEKMTEIIDEMVEEGIYTSRSDALRDAARLMIVSQRGILNGKTRYTKENRKKALKNFATKKGFKL